MAARRWPNRAARCWRASGCRRHACRCSHGAGPAPHDRCRRRGAAVAAAPAIGATSAESGDGGRSSGRASS